MAILVLYTLVGFFLLPWVIKSVGKSQISKATGRKATIESVSTNPYSLTLEVRGLEIAGQNDGEEPFFGFDRFFANISIKSLFTFSPVVQALRLERPYGRIDRDENGRFNFEDMMPEGNNEETVEPDTENGLPEIFIVRLSIEDGEIHFTDNSTPGQFTSSIVPLTFELVNFSTTESTENELSFQANTEKGARLSWNGSLGFNPITSEGRLEMHGFESATFAPYFNPYFNFRLMGGDVDIAIDYIADLEDSEHLLRFENGQFSFNNTQLYLEDSEEPEFTLSTVDISGIAGSLGQQSISIGSIKMGDGNLHINREQDRQLNLERLFALNFPDSETESPEAKPWDFSVEIIELSDFLLEINDRVPESSPATLKLAIDRITLKDVNQDMSTPVGIEGSFTIGDSGKLTISGSSSLIPLKGSLTITGQDLDLVAFQPYLSEFVDLELQDGSLGLAGDLSLSPGSEPDEGLPKVAFAGEFAVNNLKTSESTEDKDFAGFKRFALEGISVSALPLEATIETVRLSEPSLRLILTESGNNNLARILRKETPSITEENEAVTEEDEPEIEAEKKESKENVTKEYPVIPEEFQNVVIKRILIENGTFQFEDNTLEVPLVTSIESLSLTTGVLDLSSEDPLEFELRGDVYGHTPFSATGSVMPLNPGNRTELNSQLESLNLTPFTTYAERTLGYVLDSGKLKVGVESSIEDGRLDGNIGVILENFNLGSSSGSEEAINAPVKMGLSLLKNRSGVIDLDLPISGYLNDPQFSINGIIAKAFRNALLSVATSPFSVLGSIVGIQDSEELSYANFAAGSAEAGVDTEGKLTKLATALYERPEIRLAISGHYDPETDRKALAEQKLKAKLKRIQENEPDTPQGSLEQTEVYEQLISFAHERRKAEKDSSEDQEMPDNMESQSQATDESSPARTEEEQADEPGVWGKIKRFFVNLFTPSDDKTKRNRETDQNRDMEETETSLAEDGNSDEDTEEAQPLSIDEMEAELLKSVNVSETELIQLAEAREARIRELLLDHDEVDEERIDVVEPENREGQARVSFSIKVE